MPRRCKANYAALQWDEGASVLFQPQELFHRITRGMAEQAEVYREDVDPSLVTQEVVNCILATANSGQPPDACLVDIFLGIERNRKREDYFVYQTVPAAQLASAESMTVDACEVYTGPAALLPEGNEFDRCVKNDLESQCNIPSFVWSGRSTGKTPVGTFHSWIDNPNTVNNENLRRERAREVFQRVSLEMSAMILAVNSSFASDSLDVELFSAEGDALHQLMDCMFMGPYARMDYGHRGHRGTLPVPSWSRSNSDDDVRGLAPPTRAFALPCSVGQAEDSDYRAPFTCGSGARRAVIKYFVRDYAAPVGVASGQCETGEDLNTTVQVRICPASHTHTRTHTPSWPDTHTPAERQQAAPHQHRAQAAHGPARGVVQGRELCVPGQGPADRGPDGLLQHRQLRLDRPEHLGPRPHQGLGHRHERQCRPPF